MVEKPLTTWLFTKIVFILFKKVFNLFRNLNEV